VTIKVALLGAECTGKTTLAAALKAALASCQGGCLWIPEALRDWCEAHGRTPLASEQHIIVREQMRRVHEAPGCGVLLVDSSPLMTAIYSDLLFNDASLYAQAINHQRRTYDLTLVLSPDIPWVADPGQRDGPQARAKVHEQLLEVLQKASMDFFLIQGTLEARTHQALKVMRMA
jgi:nicotinamide riboside kinase